MQRDSEPQINLSIGWIDTKGDKWRETERTIFIVVMPQRSKTSEVSCDTVAIVRSRRRDDSRLLSEIVCKDGSVARALAGSLVETEQLLMVWSRYAAPVTRGSWYMWPVLTRVPLLISQHRPVLQVWQLSQFIMAAGSTKMIKVWWKIASHVSFLTLTSQGPNLLSY